MNLELKFTLLAMAEDDSRVRTELIASGELFHGYDSRIADVHQRNSQALDAIIQQHGWPGRSLVGEDGANAAWLILQHAISNPELQRKCLPLLQASASTGEMNAIHAAYLEDRICVFEGRPQRYGTQFDWDETNQLSPCTLLDAKNVDIYRASVGLDPLADVIVEMRSRAATEGEYPPTDRHKRKKEMTAWLKSVGWA